MQHKQRGVSLTGLMFWSIIVMLLAVLSMKVVPSVIDYYKISKAAKMAVSQAAPGATVADIRRAYDRFAVVDQIDSIRAADLEISKENNEIVVAWDYEKRIPLGGKVSLLLDLSGSTADKGLLP